MKLLGKVAEFVGGGLFKEIKETAMAYFPPDASPQQKMEYELKLQEFLHNKVMDANKLLEDAGRQLDERINAQEGTAADLKQIPVLGSIILFLRGVQRPTWGFATLWMDITWFATVTPYSERQEGALIVINILVLGFLFGERAAKNLQPLILKIFGKGE